MLVTTKPEWNTNSLESRMVAFKVRIRRLEKMVGHIRVLRRQQYMAKVEEANVASDSSERDGWWPCHGIVWKATS